MKTIAIVAALVILTAAGAIAADWQWPAQMTLGNFQITAISGSVDANGSGRATGTLQIPRMGNFAVVLSRSPQGDITGAAAINAAVSGGTLQGNFTLSNTGLAGRGALQCNTGPLESSDISISNKGVATGSGSVRLGRLNAPVQFSASASSCGISGEVPVSAQLDTPMASYKLSGVLALRTNLNALSGTLSGKVERTGKVSNQVTTTDLPRTHVDLSNGQCTVNVGGVSVTFSIF